MTTNSTDAPSELSSTAVLTTWNGWISDKANNLVMWIPDEYRDSLLWRGMSKFLGREPLIVDLGNAFYGTEWVQCYRPQTLG